MFEYPRFLVKDTDQFNSYNFPMIEDDIADINAGTSQFPGIYRQEMLISFMKYNSMNEKWVEANPLLASAITSGTLPLDNIGSLLNCSKNNSVFSDQVSEYLQSKLT